MKKETLNKIVSVLDWDTKFFRKRIARFFPSRATAATLESALAFSEKEKVKCLCWRADGGYYKNVILAQKYGFTLAGTRVSYERVADDPMMEVEVEGVQVREVNDADMPVVYAQTDVLSGESRFSRDKNFGIAATKRSYRQWLKRLMEDTKPTTKIFVAEIGGVVAGFIASSVETAGTVHIELIFVDEKFRGRSLGHVLLARTLAHYEKEGHKTFLVITQGSNIPAQRLYQSCGFKIKTMEFDYHKWFN